MLGHGKYGVLYLCQWKENNLEMLVAAKVFKLGFDWKELNSGILGMLKRPVVAVLEEVNAMVFKYFPQGNLAEKLGTLEKPLGGT